MNARLEPAAAERFHVPGVVEREVSQSRVDSCHRASVTQVTNPSLERGAFDYLGHSSNVNHGSLSDERWELTRHGRRIGARADLPRSEPAADSRSPGCAGHEPWWCRRPGGIPAASPPETWIGYERVEKWRAACDPDWMKLDGETGTAIRIESLRNHPGDSVVDCGARRVQGCLAGHWPDRPRAALGPAPRGDNREHRLLDPHRGRPIERSGGRSACSRTST